MRPDGAVCTLFPSTTLFRSDAMGAKRAEARVEGVEKAVAPLAGRHPGGLRCELLRQLVVQGEDHGSLAREIAIEQSRADRKSTRLNSSHSPTSYAVFRLKKK